MTPHPADPAEPGSTGRAPAPLPRALWSRPVEDTTPSPGRFVATSYAVGSGAVAGAVLGAGVGTTVVPVWGTVVGGTIGAAVGVLLGVGNGLVLAALPRFLGTRLAVVLVTAATSTLGGTGLALAIRSPGWDLVPPLAFGGVCALVGAGLGTGTPIPDDRRRRPRRT